MKLKQLTPSALAFAQLNLYDLEDAFTALISAEESSISLLEDFCRPFRYSRDRWESKDARDPDRFDQAALWMIELGEEAIKIGNRVKASRSEGDVASEDIIQSIRGHCTALNSELARKKEMEPA